MRGAAAFYRNYSVRPDGLTLKTVLSWDDAQLDKSRDVFEWLFPLDQPTLDEPRAPILSEEEIEAFRTDPVLRNGLLGSFIRVLRLYGLRIDVMAMRIAKTDDFDARSGWLYPRNFNYKRITRILRCLRLLGLETEARWFFEQLQDIYRTHDRYIGETTMRFWKNAAGVK